MVPREVETVCPELAQGYSVSAPPHRGAQSGMVRISKGHKGVLWDERPHRPPSRSVPPSGRTDVESRCREDGTGRSMSQIPSGVSRRVPVESQAQPGNGPEVQHMNTSQRRLPWIPSIRRS